jgi:hypothetical protein
MSISLPFVESKDCHTPVVSSDIRLVRLNPWSDSIFSLSMILSVSILAPLFKVVPEEFLIGRNALFHRN